MKTGAPPPVPLRVFSLCPSHGSDSSGLQGERVYENVYVCVCASERVLCVCVFRTGYLTKLGVGCDSLLDFCTTDPPAVLKIKSQKLSSCGYLKTMAASASSMSSWTGMSRNDRQGRQCSGHAHMLA